MKYSRQREALLNLLKSTRTHPTADWLYQELRKDYPNISLGTVYRNLGVLTANKDIIALHISPEREYFDGFTDEHYHFICNKCGTVLDVDLDDVEKADIDVERQTGGKVEKRNFVFSGTCAECRKMC